MTGTEDIALAALVDAFDGADLHQAHGGGVWTPLPGADARAVVLVRQVVFDSRLDRWRQADPRDGDAAVQGYEVQFRERRGGDRWTTSASSFSVFADDMASAVRDWAGWEAAWSVPPLPGADLARRRRLVRLAASKVDSSLVPVDVDLDPLVVGQLDAGQRTALARLVGELFEAGIRWRFPRDGTGARLAGKTRVLLHELVPRPHPSKRSVWLVVDGPPRRTDQRLTVGVAAVFERGAQHRWDRTPEYWRAVADPRPLSQLWGLDSPAFDEVTPLLLAGRPLDALARCDIKVDDVVRRLLAGRPSSYQQREYTAKWVEVTGSALIRSAPWLWADALPVGVRPHRLENLGGYNAAAAPMLQLDRRPTGTHLVFEHSGTPFVVPRSLWERDPDLDLLREGLITQDQIPVP